MIARIFDFISLFLSQLLTLGGLLVWRSFDGIVNQRNGARFMRWSERKRLINQFNGGFLIDGKVGRLSQRVSFQSIITTGGMGVGKSAGLVMPNILTAENCSMVVTDTSGEIYEQTAGYLESRGFSIRVLDLMQLAQSHAYNPLSRVHGYTDAERVAHIIAKGGGGAHTEPVWEDGAKRLIRILIRTLKNYEADGAPPATLAEVAQHLNAFDAHLPESRLQKWVSAGTLKDPQTWQDFQGFTQAAPEKMMLSFVSTATTTLAPVGNPELATLLSGDDFDFAALKDRPTALFIKVHQQDMQLFGFVLSLFFTDLINQLLHNRAGRVPVWLFLDEFGHMTIPGFSTFATTARKYNVGFWLFVQSLSQLRERYGDYGAETILGGLGTETYFGGVGLDTAHNLSRRFGDAFHVDLLALDKGVHQRPLMRPDEIIRLRDNRMLLLHGNRHPVRVSVLPFFKRGDLRQKAKIQPPKNKE